MKDKPFSYRYFKKGIEEQVFLDNLSEEDKEEYINEWYTYFKQMSYKTVSDYLDNHMHPDEVNNTTHDFWRKKRS